MEPQCWRRGDVGRRWGYSDDDAWGRVLGVYDGSGSPLAQSAIGNRFLWQGREYSWSTGLYYFRARWYDPVTGRWLSNDPIGISGGLNQYVFCANNSVNMVDPDGLDTYRQNRKIGGKVRSDVRSNKNPLTHTFVFTTNPDGSIEHTYSWGNAGNPHGWNIDQPEDIAAAQEALKTPKTLERKECDELDPYVHKSFQDLNKPTNEHRWWPWNQCKSEADHLLEKAQKLLDDAKRKAGK